MGRGGDRVRLSYGAALTFGVAAVAGVIGNRITDRVTPALVVFAMLVIAGMLVSYWVDRSTRADNRVAPENEGGLPRSDDPPTALVALYSLPSGSREGNSSPAQAKPRGSAPSGVAAVAGEHVAQASGGAEGVKMSGQAESSHTREAGTAACKDAWVAAVMAFSDMEDSEFRRIVLRRMGDELNLGRAFSVPYNPLARDHVVEIVDRCWDFKDRGEALRALAEALIWLRPDNRSAGNLKRMLKEV